MIFSHPLQSGLLLRRYQRFLADVRLPDANTVTAHCPNTGSLLGCVAPGSMAWLSRSQNPLRKHPWTWELVQPPDGPLIGINTARSNLLVREGIAEGVIGELQGYRHLKAEVPFALGQSRMDLLLTGGRRKACYVEVKNVTAAVDRGIALFPDAVTSRGLKHLRALATAVQVGHRAVLCFCVQRPDVEEVRPADAIDPAYGIALREVLALGVEVIAYAAEVTPREIILRRRLPVVCPPR